MNEHTYKRLMAAAGCFALCFGVATAAEITVTNVGGLGFGSVVAGSGTVSVDHDGSRICGGGVTCIPQDMAAAARFDLSGDPLASYVITLPATTSLSDSGGHSMAVDSFIDSEDGSGALDANGNGSFTVGATLHVGGGQTPGDYSGAFEVLVEYQ